MVNSRMVKVGVMLVWVLLAGESQVIAGQSPQMNNDRVYGSKDRKTKEGEEVVAIVNGTTLITEKEVDSLIGAQLYSLQESIYSLRKKALERLVLQILIKEEARARQITENELHRQLMPERAQVGQGEIDKIYAERLGALENMDEAEAKQKIRLDLESRLKFDAYRAALAKIISKARVETFLAEPVEPPSRISAEGPSRGSPDAPVTIVEFSDFQCPYCKQASAMLAPLIRSYGPRVRLVFKQMPLAIHADAFNAARASVCAAEQGKFWEYHDLLFGSSDLSVPALGKYAADLGLMPAEFNTCMKSEASSAVVRRDMREAIQADVQGTPTFFVNGKVIRGVKSLEDFKGVIDQALEARGERARQHPKR